MSRILYVDISNRGHHRLYFKCIVQDTLKRGHQIAVAMPFKESNSDNIEWYPVKIPERDILKNKWYLDLLKVVDIFKPDIIHYLYGDILYHVGLLASILPVKAPAETILSIHQLPLGKIKNSTFKTVSRRVSKIIVHSDWLRRKLHLNGINQCEYFPCPAMLQEYSLPQNTARRMLDLPKEDPIYLFIGYPRGDKGLDILLKSLKILRREIPFWFVVATGGNIPSKYMKSINNIASNKVILRTETLSDSRFSSYIDACDTLILPYRKEFSGISGPMTEAIWRGKTIIGPSSSSIGEVLSNYPGGITFSVEDPEDLAIILESSLYHKDSLTRDQLNYFRNLYSQENFRKLHENLYSQLKG